MSSFHSNLTPLCCFQCMLYFFAQIFFLKKKVQILSLFSFLCIQMAFHTFHPSSNTPHFCIIKNAFFHILSLNIEFADEKMRWNHNVFYIQNTKTARGINKSKWKPNKCLFFLFSPSKGENSVKTYALCMFCTMFNVQQRKVIELTKRKKIYIL